MSKDSDKLRFVLRQIDDVEDFITQFGSVVKMLESTLGWNAINMSIMQISETLKNKLSKDFIDRYGDALPINQAYWTRNYIAHDYENVDLLTVETIVREHLPKMKADIEMILSEIESRKGGNEK